MDIKTYLRERCRLVDEALERYLPKEDELPFSLHKAMRYSVFAGGKRVRPILMLAACEAVGGTVEQALPAACAMEMIHTYSLIHDDLPAMDDDDFRRGNPTNHKVFGEATAILAGDALHSLAFQILAEEPRGSRFAGKRSRVLSLVARAAGMEGMVGGQVRDLESEGRRINPRELRRIHRGKTGALLAASAEAGAILGGGSPGEVDALRRYGRAVGLAFQIVDDILDEEGTRAALGKSPGKDRAVKKATYPSLFGLDPSRALASRAVEEARRALAPLGRRAASLDRLAGFILARQG
jgi:geranylgeranyl diphosphate synthase type II